MSAEFDMNKQTRFDINKLMSSASKVKEDKKILASIDSFPTYKYRVESYSWS